MQRQFITRGDVVLQLRGSEHIVRMTNKVVSSLHQIVDHLNPSEDQKSLFIEMIVKNICGT
jgi:hypothetical protein